MSKRPRLAARAIARKVFDHCHTGGSRYPSPEIDKSFSASSIWPTVDFDFRPSDGATNSGCDRPGGCPVPSFIPPGQYLILTPHSLAIKGGGYATGLLHDAPPSPRLGPFRHPGIGPGPDGNPGPAGLLRSLDWRAFHHGVGEHSRPRPVHRGRSAPHGEYSLRHRRYLHAQPRPLYDCPPGSPTGQPGPGPLLLGRGFRRLSWRLSRSLAWTPPRAPTGACPAR